MSKATEEERFGDRILALEKAMGAVTDQSVNPEGRQPEVQMTLKLLHRRKTIRRKKQNERRSS